MQTPIPSHHRGEVVVPSPPYRREPHRQLPRRAEIPSPTFERARMPPSPPVVKTRLRSFSFSAVEEHLTKSFRQVDPVSGAPSQWEKTRQQEKTNGVDSIVTVVRRKAKTLGQTDLFRAHHHRRGGVRKKGAGSSPIVVSGRRDSSRLTHCRFSRAGSLPPLAFMYSTESPTANGASAAEEAPLPLNVSELSSTIGVVVPWAIDTSRMFPLRPVPSSA